MTTLQDDLERTLPMSQRVSMMMLWLDLERLLIKLEERRRVLSRAELDEIILDLKHIIDFVVPKLLA
jgi:hypothetical protein